VSASISGSFAVSGVAVAGAAEARSVVRRRRVVRGAVVVSTTSTASSAAGLAADPRALRWPREVTRGSADDARDPAPAWRADEREAALREVVTVEQTALGCRVVADPLDPLPSSS
jgi:hypothetical protein